MTGPIATIGALRAALADAPVLIAVQPGFPQAVAVGALAQTTQDTDQDANDGTESNPHPWEGTVWIAEGEPLGYLPAAARDALGGCWTR